MEIIRCFWLLQLPIICIISRLCQTKDFSQTQLVVWYSPHISQYTPPNAYNQSHLLVIIGQISTKFSRIMMQHFIETGKDTDLVEFPLAVATFNKLRRSGGAGVDNGTNLPPPLELIMMFKEKHFNLTKKIADEANLVFPNTIRTLLYFPDALTTTTASEVVANLARYKPLLAETTTTTTPAAAIPVSYKLGLYTGLEKCGSVSKTYLEPELPPVLPHLDAIFFSWLPTLPSYYHFAYGAEYCAKMLIKLASVCKDKMMMHSRNHPALMKEVGFRSHWPDTGPQEGVRNVKDLVIYWELLNEFASSSNSSVVPSDAFDDFYKWKGHRGYDTLGWWRLVEKDGRGVTNPADFVFEEKAQTVTAAVAPAPLELPTASNNVSSTTTRVISSFPPSSLLMEDGDENQGDFSPHSSFDTPTVALVVVGATTSATVLGLLITTIIYKRAKLRGQKKREEPKSLRKIEKGPPIQWGSLELDISSVEICDGGGSVLGSGEFGVVLRGILRSSDTGDDDEFLPVAVKIPKKSTTPAIETAALKALVDEIKILSCVGHHDNVLKLVGVVSDSSRPDLFLLMVTELCELGSLEKHLRSLRADEALEASIIITPIRSGEAAGPYCNWSEPSFLPELKSWSYQIATGMEYLASKHVVHADLATRNVLLNGSKIAKVSDFGLSRRLAEGADYYKKGDTSGGGAPWRWMSPEALKHWKFNEKSDVWAFGVTLWEMFSLGETPYPNEAWTEDFEFSLDQQNMRLKRPKWSDLTMYDIMLRCWEPEPGDRPPFADLGLMLHNIVEAGVQQKKSDH